MLSASLPTFALLSIVVSFPEFVRSAPLGARSASVSQSTSASTAAWLAACNAAGGGVECTLLAEQAGQALGVSAKYCDQQDAADTMVSLAKRLNSQKLVTLTQLYVQQPRNFANGLSAPYCQKKSSNSELNGLYHCQFEGASSTEFAGYLHVGEKGTIPFGLSHAVSPAGGCPAHTSGPIPDGVPINTLTGNAGLDNIRGFVTSDVAEPSVIQISSDPLAELLD